MTKTITQLIDDLTTEGGAIVSSSSCSSMELNDARQHGRFAVTDDGMGYVRRMKEWLDRVHEQDGYDPGK